MPGPWTFNVVSPTRYRMQLAHEFSQKARRIFGDRWKGLYVIGSAASGMCHHLGDLDVFPLIEGPRSDGETGIYQSWWEDAERLSVCIERSHGVSIDMWKTSLDIREWKDSLEHSTAFCSLEVFRIRGPEAIITSEAVLVDADPDVGLAARIERPEWPAQYARSTHVVMRGEYANARVARIAYERKQAYMRKRVLAYTQDILPRFCLGDMTPVVAAFVLQRNFVFPSGTVPKGFDIYHRFEFLVSQEPKIRAFLGMVPSRSTMVDGLIRFTRQLNAPGSEEFRQKLILLDRILRDAGMDGVPAMLIQNPAFRNAQSSGA